jgi:hypothetical protein
MKHRMIAIAGFLAIAAVLTTSYATPAVAQWMKVALVRNVDEKGRTPYMQFQALACSGESQVCQVVFPPVPPGTRLVVERVNASVNFAESGIRLMGLLVQQSILFALPAPSSAAPNPAIVNEAALVYYESGQTPIFHIVTANPEEGLVTVFLSGYLVNLEQ